MSYKPLYIGVDENNYNNAIRFLSEHLGCYYGKRHFSESTV
jgi:hypothetical protein